MFVLCLWFFRSFCYPFLCLLPCCRVLVVFVFGSGAFVCKVDLLPWLCLAYAWYIFGSLGGLGLLEGRPELYVRTKGPSIQPNMKYVPETMITTPSTESIETLFLPILKHWGDY